MRHGAPERKIVTRQDAAERAARARSTGQTVVFTNGCFDLFHYGHLSTLRTARGAGDILIVGVNACDTVRRLKGPGRPLLPARERARAVAELTCVDLVVVFDEDTPHALVQEVRPDVLAKGGDYSRDEIVGAAFVESYGGRVLIAQYVSGVSTTAIVRSAADGIGTSPPARHQGITSS